MSPGVDANLPRYREGNGESRMSVEVRAESESGQSSISEEEATPSGRLDRNLLNTLANILRHGDLELGHKLLPGGYLFVEEIVKGHPGFVGYSLPDIHKVVKFDVDKRFTLMRDIDSGCWKIRANQGHSLVVDTPEIPLVEKNEVLQGYHYTTMASWGHIKEEGLRKIGRQYIPLVNKVSNSFKPHKEVEVQIDVQRAQAEGYTFFWSPEVAVLCPGNQEGIILPTYVIQALHLDSGEELHLGNLVAPILLTGDQESSVANIERERIGAILAMEESNSLHQVAAPTETTLASDEKAQESWDSTSEGEADTTLVEKASDEETVCQRYRGPTPVVDGGMTDNIEKGPSSLIFVDPSSTGEIDRKATGFTTGEFDRKATTERNIPLYKGTVIIHKSPVSQKSASVHTESPNSRWGSLFKAENIGARYCNLPTPTVDSGTTVLRVTIATIRWDPSRRQWDPGIPALYKGIKSIQVMMENEGGSAQSPRSNQDLQPFSVQGLVCIKERGSWCMIQKRTIPSLFLFHYEKYRTVKKRMLAAIVNNPLSTHMVEQESGTSPVQTGKIKQQEFIVWKHKLFSVIHIVLGVALGIVSLIGMSCDIIAKEKYEDCLRNGHTLSSRNYSLLEFDIPCLVCSVFVSTLLLLDANV
ncbi:TRPT1 [Mytilus coruscus]|uniref:2'-phosphotransferase n=1 Tax=Mytilus coruscus TaxID=42192 RepID=A0A6J8BAP2_MYTCO|nr:TRPT1 [Mytilus coruscus]